MHSNVLSAQVARTPRTAAPRIPCAKQEDVNLCRHYRHAAWYMLFVAVYMIVLYFQVSAKLVSISIL